MLETIESVSLRTSTLRGEETPLLKVNLTLNKVRHLESLGKQVLGEDDALDAIITSNFRTGEQLLINGGTIDWLWSSNGGRAFSLRSARTHFSHTIRENMLFGKEDATDEEIWEALTLASFWWDVKRMPQQLIRWSEKKNLSLSGQKQRLWLRVPSAILDDGIRSWCENETQYLILFLHRLSAFVMPMNYCDERGCVVSAVPTRSYSQRGWYEQYLIQEIEEESNENDEAIIKLPPLWEEKRVSIDFNRATNRTSWQNIWLMNVITPMGQSHVSILEVLWVGIYVAVNLVRAAGGYLNRLLKTLSRGQTHFVTWSIRAWHKPCQYRISRPFACRKVVSGKSREWYGSVRANFYVNGISTLLSTVVMLVQNVYNAIFLLNAAWIRVIIPSSGYDTMAANRCLYIWKKYYTRSRELYSQLSGRLNRKHSQGAGIVQAFNKKIVAEYDATATS